MPRSKLAPFHDRLLQWYKENGRHHLPWRETRDPYKVWVSEVMLQQTQVDTVLEKYYGPFLEQFPTVQALATASQYEVLKAWQGLGYYNRANNMHRAAQIAAEPDFKWDSYDALIKLPGIGHNTAQAILAFAFKQKVAIMEANLKRILHRIAAAHHLTEVELWDMAEKLLDRAHPFEYNQSMMDLGAMVCTKRRPQCTICPANEICKGKGDPEQYPGRRKMRKVPVHKKIIIVFQNQDGLIYARPRDSRFLQGLYQFVEVTPDTGAVQIENAIYLLTRFTKIGHVKQAYSHLTLDGIVHFLKIEHHLEPGRWHTREELKALPLSKAEEKILAMLPV